LLNWVLVLQPKPYQASPGGDHQTFQLNSGQGQSKSPFAYRLVERKPKAGVLMAAVFVLILFMVSFYFLGMSNTH
ncbi:MAG: hypothetical protein SGJ27_11530, partial [Candidatus Melainabacteria bacterium]|nr:hypothetical protein [Candidatus Melainabacteria bacterium]